MTESPGESVTAKSVAYSNVIITSKHSARITLVNSFITPVAKMLYTGSDVTIQRYSDLQT